MVAAKEQLNLPLGHNVFDEDDPKKLKWEKYDGHWRALVYNTRKEHACSKCGAMLPIGSRASKTLDFDGLRPEKEDFQKIQYWHLNAKCPEPPIEDEPI